MVTSNGLTIGFLVHDIARDIRHVFDVRTRDLGVTRQQWRALICLSRSDGLTQTELADALEVERISAGRMVDRLVENGLVERRADPLDRRVWRLHLLPPSSEIIKKVTDISVALDEEVLSHIAGGKREELTSLLEQLRAGLKTVRANCCDGQRKVA